MKYLRKKEKKSIKKLIEEFKKFKSKIILTKIPEEELTCDEDVYMEEKFLVIKGYKTNIKNGEYKNVNIKTLNDFSTLKSIKQIIFLYFLILKGCKVPYGAYHVLPINYNGADLFYDLKKCTFIDSKYFSVTTDEYFEKENYFNKEYRYKIKSIYNFLKKNNIKKYDMLEDIVYNIETKKIKHIKNEDIKLRPILNWVFENIKEKFKIKKLDREFKDWIFIRITFCNNFSETLLLFYKNNFVYKIEDSGRFYIGKEIIKNEIQYFFNDEKNNIVYILKNGKVEKNNYKLEIKQKQKEMIYLFNIDTFIELENKTSFCFDYKDITELLKRKIIIDKTNTFLLLLINEKIYVVKKDCKKVNLDSFKKTYNFFKNNLDVLEEENEKANLEISI